MSTNLFDFAIVTIFARECLEGAIIIGQYRTIIMRCGGALAPGITQRRALSEVTIAALGASALALFVIACIAIPLAILSQTFDTTTAYIIEGISKIVAAVSLLQLSLKVPRLLGIYGSSKKSNGRESDHEVERQSGMTLSNIRFIVAWNIWREVAECGVFLIPFFLSGKNLAAIPLSAVIGSCVGFLCGVGIYYANKRLTKKLRLCIFAVLLLVVLSAGLFTGGCHKLEEEIGSTKEVWRINGEFWDVNRLPMTIFKPFGYNDSRTVLEILCFWLWLALSALLHYRKYRISSKPSTLSNGESGLSSTRQEAQEEMDTVELGESFNGDSQDGIVNRTSIGAQQCSGIEVNLTQSLEESTSTGDTRGD